MVAGPLTLVQMIPSLETGGVERGTLEMGAHMVRAGHRSLVVSGGGRLVAQLTAQGSVHIRLPVGAKDPRCLLCVPRLRRLLIECRVDVLHLRSRLPAYVGWAAVKSLPHRKRPSVVSTFHGIYSASPYSAVMTKGDRVIAISHFVAEHIRRHYAVQQRRLVIIPRGYDPGVFDPARVSPQSLDFLKRKWGLDKDGGPVILLPARFTAWKGHMLLLDALQRIDHLSWCAVFAGEVNENPEYARAVEHKARFLGLGDRVHLVGHCPDMAAAMTLAHVVVSASMKPEAFGRVAVEAQAMGRPVVATAHGGSLETVRPGRTGWLVTPFDPEPMAAALQQALEDGSRTRAMGRDAAAWVASRFSTEKMCRRTLSVYGEVTLEKKASGVRCQ